MSKIYFDTWTDAASKARECAIDHDCSPRVGKEGSKFYVDVSSDVKWVIDYEDYLREEDERLEELEIAAESERELDAVLASQRAPEPSTTTDVDYVENQARSQDGGWYYEE